MTRHQERVYSPVLVERFIRNYFDVMSTLAGGKAVPSPDSSQVTKDPDEKLRSRTSSSTHPEPDIERPLGYDGRPWPFMTAQRAQPPRDGKGKARQMEELHCMCLDFEAATFRVSTADLRLIYAYHVFQTHTLDQLAAELGLRSRGSLQARIGRAVQRLTVEMENAGIRTRGPRR